MTAFMQVENVRLRFGDQTVFDKFHLKVNQGEFVSVVGRSGVGKSTLIQMMAGLLEPSEGKVLLNGEKIEEPHQDVTYVFQKPVLLEWRNVMENILLPAEIIGKVGGTEKKRVRELLDVVGLGEHGQKYPHECSGGMLSRAALARALFTNPRLLLMDEPFSGLDAITKEQLQLELTKVVESYDVAVVFITHDIQEAVFLADRVLLLSDEAEIKEYSVPFQRQREKPLKFTSAFTEIVKKIHRGLDQGASA